ncbi:MAG: hypothetical protein K940chlam2_00300 [Chlamydiae bacterium]|nr:hypothetical protein [Chlamydiota bacterium]
MSYSRISWSNLLGQPTYKNSEELLSDLLLHLAEIDSTKVIPLLSQAGNRLHRILQHKGFEAADQELIEAYCPPFKELFLEIKKQNPSSLLFTPLGLRLVHYLLIHNVADLPKKRPIKTFGTRTFVKNQNLWCPLPSAPEKLTDLSLSGVFLWANELLDQLFPHSLTTDTEQFYLHRLYEFTGVSGRIRALFENDYFNKEFSHRFGFGISPFLGSLVSIFLHTLAKDPMVLSPSVSYQRYPEEVQASVKAAISHLSVDLGYHAITLKALHQALKQDLTLDSKARGKPLLNFQELEYCIRPDLLATALANLPIHMILIDAQKKEEGKRPGNLLWTKMGDIFEQFCFDKTSEILGTGLCERPSSKNPLGDIIVLIDSNCHLMIETKATSENDTLLAGDRKEIVKKILLPKPYSKDGPNPGPLQVMQRAMEYRNRETFKGELFTAVIYLNPPPTTSEFDNLYHENISGKDIQEAYRSDPINKATILLSMSQWELILSAVHQGGSLRNILTSLVNLPPSRVEPCIIESMSSQKMQVSSAPIYRSEIKALADTCRKGAPAN